MGGQFFDDYSQADQSIWWVASNSSVCAESAGRIDSANDGDPADWIDGAEYCG